MKIIALFNNKGGIGRTTLVYHLAWMYADLGLSVAAADFDPQANLTSMFLDEDTLESLWADGHRTLLTPILPLLKSEGHIADPPVETLGSIGLLAGDLALSRFEDELSRQWLNCLGGNLHAFQVMGAFHQVLVRAARRQAADIVLIDMGPSLDAINRAALIAADYVVTPLAPDMLSLRELQNFGPCLREWRRGWKQRLEKSPAGLDLPQGAMEPLGYVVTQAVVRLNRPEKNQAKWAARIPSVYREAVLGEESLDATVSTDRDPYCLSTLKPYHSLIPLAQEARKPIFYLTPADGAIGGYAKAVQDSYQDFRRFALTVAQRAGIAVVEKGRTRW